MHAPCMAHKGIANKRNKPIMMTQSQTNAEGSSKCFHVLFPYSEVFPYFTMDYYVIEYLLPHCEPHLCYLRLTLQSCISLFTCLSLSPNVKDKHTLCNSLCLAPSKTFTLSA